MPELYINHIALKLRAGRSGEVALRRAPTARIPGLQSRRHVLFRLVRTVLLPHKQLRPAVPQKVNGH